MVVLVRLNNMCHSCHFDLHHDKLKLKLNGKRKSQLKHATQMNSISSVVKIYSETIETFGCITKANRLLHNIDKEHYLEMLV